MRRTKAQKPANSRPDDYARDLEASLQQSAVLAQTLDAEREYLIRRAPNAIEWIVGEDYCNQPNLYRHFGAYQLVKDFFELRCPVCNEGPDAIPARSWGLTRSELEREVLLKWRNSAQDDACPKCRTTRAEFIENKLMKGYRILHAVVGQRSGKSSTLALICTYVEHVCLTIAHAYDGGLHAYFSVLGGDPFDISVVASNQDQAADTIWAKYRGYRELSPWFRRYVPWLKQQEKLQDTPDGMAPWTYVENQRDIANGFAKLKINSLNSNSHGQRGRTRIFAAIDEISHMQQTDGGTSGQEVYRAFNASCQTVRIATERYGLLPWMGMVGSISSPVSVDDYGMKLLKMAESDAAMFTQHMSTWEFSPFITREMLGAEFLKDFVGAQRDFGARPPSAANPFIDRPNDFLTSVIDPSLKATAFFESYDIVDATGREMLGVRLTDADLILGGTQRYMAVDAGANFDAFSVACAHGEPDDDGNIVTVYDWCIRLLTKSKRQEVYFESVYQLLAELNKYMTIKTIEFDHWNSKAIVQRIRNDLGVWAEEATTTSEHFIQFLRDGYSGYIRMLPELPGDATADPRYKSAQGAAIYELLKLDRDPKNDKVFNARKGLTRGVDSDDTARVLIHAHRLVQQSGYTERQDDVSRRARRKKADAAAAEWSARGRGQLFKPSSIGIGGGSNGPGRGW